MSHIKVRLLRVKWHTLEILRKSILYFAENVQAWNVLALDGSNWQKIDLFNFQTDIEVKEEPATTV